MRISERIAEVRKQYPETKYDVVFDESGSIVAVSEKLENIKTGKVRP